MSVGQKSVRLGEEGQSTVEFALVTFAFLAMVVALGLMWRAAHEGAFVRRGLDAASHVLSGGVGVGALQDIALF